jgi:molecular chaperone HtpG
MSAEEIKKYINQIAFSGATEFVEKFKNVDTSTIIGKFGLGFYSSFMVADKVEIRTKSYRNQEDAAHWTCTGTTDFEINKDGKTERGTDVILHINADSEDYLSEHRIREILRKYCRFLPVEIVFGTKEIPLEGQEELKEGEEPKTQKVDDIINETKPLWTRNPNDLKDEDYLSFYKKLYEYAEDPLFWIHLNVDYPFNLTGILYFPKVRQDIAMQKHKIQLYSRQVFITDEVKGIVPEFLTLMHGVIDSPDIPLNVSRSYLQSDQNVKKITGYITKKVGEKLQELFNKDRAVFEQKWESIGLFAKYGMMTDEKFWEKAKGFGLLESLDGKKFTFDEYQEHIKTNQTDKNGNKVIIYSTEPAKQDAYIQSANRKGYDVLKMDGMLDNHFISTLEQKLEKVSLRRVDADIIEKLIEKDVKIESVLSDSEQDKIKDIFKKVLQNDKLELKVEALPTDEMPVIITMSEFMRRMQEMSQMQGYAHFLNPDMNFQNITINGNHQLIGKILKTTDETTQKRLTRQAYDLALLSQGKLAGKELTEFIQRTIQLEGN